MNNSKPSKVLFVLGILVLFLGIAAAANYVFVQFPNRLRSEVYSEFTCTCCDGSLLQTGPSCYMAGGMREYINSLIHIGTNKEKVMIDAVAKLGITNLVNLTVARKYALEFYNNTPQYAPGIVIEPETVELGDVSNSGPLIIQDFHIRNEGNDDLIITDLKTSCSCLEASFIKYGKESVKVGRFSNSEGWTFILMPGEEATMRTYYDAKLTNWQLGSVERIISITSNDPVNFIKYAKILVNLVE